MDTIRALVADPAAPGRIAMRAVAAPEPAPTEAVIAVEVVSLNGGEVRALGRADDGWRPGWDLAGVVMHEAADGTGPATGSRVVGLAPGGSWAERVAVPTSRLTPLPDSVDAARAATLPVAGLTALRAVEMADSVDNHSVLVTGASGGVGRFAVQLAAQLGADVTALVSSPERGQPLPDLGAAVVVLTVPESTVYDVILESVGGDVLGQALHAVGPAGLIVSYGNSSEATTTFDVGRFYHQGGARLYAFALRNELARSGSGALDLARLVEMVAEGHLDTGIVLDAPWTDASSAVEAFGRREIAGKAVLRIS